ncbi:MAG: winged helix-turn-helix domain-containing protein, partial [Sphingomonadales bacterium]
MGTGDKENFQVGDWQVEPRLNLLSRDGRATSLRPRVMDLLVFMSGRAGDVISVEEVIDEVWDGVFVTNGVVYNCVNELRATFNDTTDAPNYIETIAKRGYRMIATVSFPEGRPVFGRRAE